MAERFSRDGPRDWAELMMYPDRNLQDVITIGPNAAKRKELLGHNYRRGFSFWSEFSGLRGAEVCMHFNMLAIKRAGFHTQVEPIVEYTNTCDSNKTCQGVILNEPANECKAKHLYKEINERLPLSVTRLIHEMEPKEDCSFDAALASNIAIVDHLDKHRHKFFCPRTADHCLICNSTHSTYSDLQQRLMKNLPVPDDRRVIGSHVSSECVAFSSRGGHGKGSHHSYVSAGVIAVETKALAEQCALDFTVQENDKNYHVGFLKTLWNGVLGLVSTKQCPSRKGWAIGRERTLIFSWNLTTSIWHGPTDPTAEFEALFGRSLNCDPDVFFVDSTAGVLKELKKTAKKRGFHLADDVDVNAIDHRQFLPPLMRRRLLDHVAKKEQLQSLGGEFVTDLEQNANFQGGGATMAAVTTHVAMWNHTLHRLSTSKELAASHGIPLMEPSTGYPFELPSADVLNGLTKSDLQRLIGNGLHWDVYSAWLLYCLSYLQLKKDVVIMVNELGPSSADFADGDIDVDDDAMSCDSGKDSVESEEGSPPNTEDGSVHADRQNDYSGSGDDTGSAALSW